VRTPDPGRLAKVAVTAGGKVREWENRTGVTVRRLPQSRITELAAEADIAISAMRPQNAVVTWFAARMSDAVAWRARGYFMVKLPLAVAATVLAAACWLGGLFYLTFPVWWVLGLDGAFGGPHVMSLAGSFIVLPLGAVCCSRARG
jgi:Putative sensor